MKYRIEEQFNISIQPFLKSANASFLQSKMWFDFQKKLGRKTYHITVSQDNNCFGSCILIALPLALNKTYLYAPHGPIISENHSETLKHIYSAAKEIAKKEKALFFRFDPEITHSNSLAQAILKSEAKRTDKEVQPQETITLDVQKNEEELLKSFHSKTRYNIRLAKRKGVTVRTSQHVQDIDIFYTLAQATQSRNTFGFHSKDYFKKQFDVLVKNNSALLYIAEYENTPVAANIVVFYANKGIYLHGASSNTHRNVMGPHLLQWEQIRETKKRGFAEYDFWGATSSEDTSHQWYGVTRFKKGFSKHFVSYIGAYDLIFNPVWYSAYSFYINNIHGRTYNKRIKKRSAQ